MMARKKAICKHCKKVYIVDYNGTTDGCDKCTGYERNKDGALKVYKVK